jgi:hypothetical protein
LSFVSIVLATRIDCSNECSGAIITVGAILVIEPLLVALIATLVGSFQPHDRDGGRTLLREAAKPAAACTVGAFLPIVGILLVPPKPDVALAIAFLCASVLVWGAGTLTAFFGIVIAERLRRHFSTARTA